MIPQAPKQDPNQAQKPLEIDEDELDEDALDEVSGGVRPEFRHRHLQLDAGGHGSLY
jgi:hypothetical protein